MNPLLLQGLFTAGQALIDRLFPDPAKADAAKLELLKMQQSGELAQLAADTELAKAQLAVNQAEAASGNAYAASWRPTIGFVLAAALAWMYVLQPIALWAAAIWKPGFQLPNLPVDEHLWELIAGMLGLSGWRSLDKIKGAAK